MPKLFAVYLGGVVAGCHIEQHDVRFAAGEKIEDTFDTLRSEWIGDFKKLHMDAYMELKYVDGYEVSLSSTPAIGGPNLYFVNCGGYDPNRFTELHEIGFFVGEAVDDVKRRALKAMLDGSASKHRDDLFDVDDCIRLGTVGDLHVHLAPTSNPCILKPDWFGYRRLDRETPAISKAGSSL